MRAGKEVMAVWTIHQFWQIQVSLIYEVATTRPKNKQADALGKTLTTLIFLTLRGQIGSWMTNFLQGRLHHLAWPLPNHHETAIPNPIIWQPKIETDILRCSIICFIYLFHELCMLTRDS